jgi:hypothetical protein
MQAYLIIHLIKNNNYDDDYLGSGIILKNAIKKYGKENFIRKTLEVCTEENVGEREEYWIEKLKSRDKLIGYNIAKGGIGGDLITNNPNFENIKKKMSKNHCCVFGNKNPNYSGKYSKRGKEHHYYGKKRTEEDKIKIRTTIEYNGGRRGKNNGFYGNSKYIYFAINGNKKYEQIISLIEFCRKHKLKYCSIKASIKYNRKYKTWKFTRILKEKI